MRTAITESGASSDSPPPPTEREDPKMTQTETPIVDNGVNIEALRGARQALTDAPEAARFQWRARC